MCKKFWLQTVDARGRTGEQFENRAIFCLQQIHRVFPQSWYNLHDFESSLSEKEILSACQLVLGTMI